MTESRKRILHADIEKSYPIVLAVARGSLKPSNGISQIIRDFGMNVSSATDCVMNFKSMLKGTKYTRTNTIFTTDLYLTNILRDFGQESYRNAISAVEQHVQYYESVRKINMNGLRGILAKHEVKTATPYQREKKKLEIIAKKIEKDGEFDLHNIRDNRQWVLQNIARRQGQSRFRVGLLMAYRGRCAITGSCVDAVLEAAHIVGYKGPCTDYVENGLLLRSDLHTLFDMRLIAIESNSLTILVSAELDGSVYEKYRGKKLRQPKDKRQWPNKSALDEHRKESGL